MKKSLLLAGILLAAASAVLADTSRYQPFIVGERAAGMGGAAVAAGRGIDAAYYNPAGLAWTTQSSLSLSANLYGFQREKIKGGLIAGDDQKSDSFVTIPAAVGGVWRLGDRLTGSFALLQPTRSSAGEITAKSGGARTYAYDDEDQSVWFGPSVGWQASDEVSVGIGVYGVYQSAKQNNDLYDADSGNMFSQHAVYNTTAVLALLGVQWNLPDSWRLGASLQTPTLSLTGNGKLSLNVREDGIDYNYYGDHLDARGDLPAKLAAGIARQEEKKYAYGLDVTYHFPHDHRMIKVNGNGLFSDTQLWVRRNGVLDVNLGGEYYIAGRYPVRAGLYTSFAAADDIERDDAAETSDVDLYGATCSIGVETDRTAFNVGLDFAYGDGHDMGYTTWGDDSVRTSASIGHLMATVSTSYFF